MWDITDTEYQEIKGFVVPDKSDAYVIGICFDNYQKGSEVYVDDVDVKNGRPSATPVAPYNFAATPAQDGSLQVKLVWYTPNTNLAGDFISHVDKMELYRDGIDEPLYTTQATGATLAAQYVDADIPEKGEYTYRVYAYLDGLKSYAAVISVKVGYSVPSQIEGLTLVENDDHSVTISWDKADSEYGDVKYYIERNGSEVLDDDFSGTTFVDKGIDTSYGQQPVYYIIQPYNEVGYGRITSSNLMFIGESSLTPFKESFAGGEPTHLWMNEKVVGYDAAGWTKQTVSLDKFKGEKNVRLSFKGISAITHDILIDNMTVGEKQTSGIGSTLTDGVRVYASDDEIVVNAPAESDVRIFNAGGAQLYAGRVADVRVAVAKGLYVVTVDGRSTKITVR